MHAKKVVAVHKGTITISEETLNFSIGLFIAVIILISVWWLFLHNQSERITEQNVDKLYNTIVDVCNDGVKRTIPFYSPQEAGFQGWVNQNLRVVTGNMGTSPYFYIYYGDFPPDFQGICSDPATGIACYWREDLPWNNNLVLTGVTDAFFGLPLGNKYMQKIGEALRKGTFAGFTLGEKAAVKLTGGFYKGIKSALTEGFDKFADKMATSSARTLKLAEVERDALEGINADEFFWNLYREGIVEKVGDKFRIMPEYQEAVEQILKENPGYEFPLLEIEKTTTGEIKDMFYNLYAHADSYKEKAKNIFLNLNKLGYEDSLTTKGAEEFIEKVKALSPERKAELFDTIGLEPSVVQRLKTILSPNKLTAFKSGKIDDIIKGLESDISHGGLIMVPKGSTLAEYLDKYGDTAFDHYLQDISKIKGEGGLLRDLFERKVLLLPENLEKFNVQYQAPYILLLRPLDMFTPAGATYWDRQISPYSGTSCESGELCLKMGLSYVRKHPLEESGCFDKGVTEIKLKRNSLVASNPSFYLVSPCFAMLDITKEGNTIYIEPKICKGRTQGFENNPNYCFATAGMVNFYTSDETASLVLGFIPGYGQAIQFGLDVLREATITYPYAYELGAGVGDKLMGNSVWEGKC